MGWLDDHIKSFVEPVIGEFDRAEGSNFFIPEELSVIKSAWKSVKRAAKGSPILLPGRDVFVFEILARRENYPTLFVPECSRGTVSEIGQILAHNMEKYYIFDTGFMGSIPRKLQATRFSLLSYNLREETVGVQVFPRLTLSRGLALKIEGTPKYWETGRMVEGKIEQPLSKLEEFKRAAQLTVEVFTNSSPKFVAKPKPLSSEVFPGMLKGGI